MTNKEKKAKAMPNTSDDFITLAEIGTGWITPKGDCVACYTYQDLAVLSAACPDLVATVQQRERDCPDSHHSSLYEEVCRIGWVRVGAYYQGSEIHFKGTDRGIRAQSRTICNLEVATGFDAVLEIVS